MRLREVSPSSFQARKNHFGGPGHLNGIMSDNLRLVLKHSGLHVEILFFCTEAAVGSDLYIMT